MWNKEPTAVSSRGAGVWWLVAAITTFILYRLTMAPGLLWGDSGEAQLHVLMGGWTLGDQIVRSHPVFYALARSVRWLLAADAAHAANLASTLAGAITIANVTWILRILCRRLESVICGVAALGLSHTLWQLSTSAEVVTTTTALLTAELIGVVLWTRTGRLRWLAWAAFFNGLGLSNHNFAMLMWPVYVTAAIRFRSAWSTNGWRVLGAATPAFLIGATPLLALCYIYWQDSHTFGETVRSFLTGKYGSRIAPWQETPKLLLRAAAFALLNYPTPLLILVLPGAVELRRITGKPLAWVFIGGAMMYSAFGATYNVADQHTFLVPAFVFMAVLLAVGVESASTRHRNRSFGAALVCMAFVSPLAYAIAPYAAAQAELGARWLPQREVPFRDPYRWFLQPWRNGERGAEQFAVEVLNQLPDGAWLVADSTMAPPINYVQVEQSRRLDVRLLSSNARQPWLAGTAMSTELEATVDQGLLYSTTAEPRYLPPWLRQGPYELRREGIVHLVRRKD